MGARGSAYGGKYCCDHAWLNEFTDIGEVNRWGVGRTTRRPDDAGLLFDSGRIQLITSNSLCYFDHLTGNHNDEVHNGG